MNKLSKVIKISCLEDFSIIYTNISKGEVFKDIDVSELTFFEPKEILMLVQYFVLQNKSGIDGNLHTSEGNNWYIDIIGMVEFCNTNYINPKQLKTSSYHAIPIKRIDTTTLTDYISHAKAFFKKFCEGKDTMVLDICIAELINNVYDHARSPIDAYIFSQYYRKKNTIKFAISDLGIGIVASVNEYHQGIGNKTLSSVDAINWAFMKGKTSKSTPRNKGAGLDNVISFLRGTNSELEIFTDNVYCKLTKNGALIFKENPIRNFIGTLITISINIDKLEAPDETILEEFTF